MAVYSLACIYEPQLISNGAAALIFKPSPGGTTVPVGYAYKVQTCRVRNVTANPVALTIWRVNQGGGTDLTHLVCPSTVNIPPASQTNPWFDVTTLWGAYLGPGDSIWAQAGAVSALNIDADGIVITI